MTTRRRAARHVTSRSVGFASRHRMAPAQAQPTGFALARAEAGVLRGRRAVRAAIRGRAKGDAALRDPPHEAFRRHRNV